MKKSIVIIMVIGLLLSIVSITEFGYCASKRAVSGAGVTVLEGHLSPNGAVDSKPLIVEEKAVITGAEGAGMGFYITRIADKGKEEKVVDVSSPEAASGTELEPGVYKVYPKAPEFGSGGGMDIDVKVYLATIRG